MKFYKGLFLRTLLIFGCFFTSNKFNANPPHAYITAWNPGSYGNCLPAERQRQKGPLPIYIKASFNVPVSDSTIEAYITFLKPQLKQLSKTKNRGEIAFTVPGTTTRQNVESILNQANNHFRLEFEKQQKITALASKANIDSNPIAKGSESKYESIKIVNNTDSSLNVNFTVPEQTVASIKLKKLDALHDAIVADSSEKIRQAILDGADINHIKDGKTPLLWAILLRHYNAVDTLLLLGAKPDDTCITLATTMRDIKFLLWLVRQGQANIDIKQVADIIAGSINNNCSDSIAMIRELVNRGYNANALWSPAIILAHNMPLEGEEVIRFLLSRGANPNHIEVLNNTVEITPLIRAAVYCPNKQIVKILINAGADINKPIRPNRHLPQYSLLAYAIEKSNHQGPDILARKEVIAFLLEQGASL